MKGERSASILSRLQNTHGISEGKIVHTETSKLQQDKETNFFIFCQAYPIPVAISAYITQWLPHTQLKPNVRINKQMERVYWFHYYMYLCLLIIIIIIIITITIITFFSFAKSRRKDYNANGSSTGVL